MKAIYAVPATAALVYRAYSHKSLTPLGIVVAALTATAHAVHPWNLPFVLLVVFFLAGTRVTKVKKDIKASLTLHAHGDSGGGEGPRTHVQVLANSFCATVLSLLHARQLSQRNATEGGAEAGQGCFAWGGDILVIGIVANYAAVCADTFSSELGILARTEPRLITSFNLRKVPRGTNGGVTLWGLVAGFLGSLIVVLASVPFLPFCQEEGSVSVSWTLERKALLVAGLTVWGTLGSLLDSFLGGWFQRSVRDARSGKIVEGEGGTRVLVSSSTPASSPKKGGNATTKPSRIVESGFNLLDNNEVNFLMALTMSLGGMAVAGWFWGVPLASIVSA